MSKSDLSTLESRPRWGVVRRLKWLAIGFAVIACICFVGVAFLNFLDSIALNGTDEENGIYLNISVFLDELAWTVVGIGFYAAVLWLLSEILDKIDQIVWINADVEDRTWIYNQRKKKKKNAKNQ